MTIGFSITGCSNSKNRFDERTQDWLVKKFGLRRPRRLDANRAQPHVLLVCYTAVFTQRSSPQTARSVAWRHQTRLCSRRPFSLLNQEENKRRFCWQSDNVQLWERNDAQNLFKKYFKKCLNVLALDCRFKTNKQTNKQIAPCKGIQYSLGFWIPPCGFRIPSTRFQYLSIELGFWIPWAVFRIPRPRISNFISKIFLDSGIRIPLIWGEKKEKQTRQPISKGSRSKCTNL